MPHRVLWLIKGLGLGGAERLLVSMASRFDRSRFDVEVAYVLRSDDAFVGELDALGVRTTCLQGSHTLDPRWVASLRRLLKRDPYHLVHTHSPVPASAARLLAPAATRFVHTEHNTWPSYAWPTFVANAATFSRNRAVIAVSAAVASSIRPPGWVRQRCQPPVEVLHHGVDLTRIPHGVEARRAARDRLALTDESFVVGMVASFTARKDHQILFDAISRVRREVDTVRLLLFGSGPTEAELRTAVEHQGLAQHVRFLGSRPDVLELLPALDLFVLSSRFEGLPIAMLEAMAAGVPVVATRVGGIPEAVTDGREGRLVELGDREGLAAAIRQMSLDPDRRAAMGSAGATRVAEEFEIGAAVDRHEHLYDAVFRRSPDDVSDGSR